MTAIHDTLFICQKSERNPDKWAIIDSLLKVEARE